MRERAMMENEREFWQAMEQWIAEQDEPIGPDDLSRLVADLSPRFPEGLIYLERAMTEIALAEEHLSEEEQIKQFEGSPLSLHYSSSGRGKSSALASIA